MNHTSKKLFSKISFALFLASILTAVCFRKKILSLICYWVLKIFAGGLYVNSTVELHDFTAAYSDGGRVHINTGILWNSVQGQRVASVKSLKLKLDLSKLYSVGNIPTDLHASGLDLNLDAARMPGSGSALIAPRMIVITDGRATYNNKTYDLKVITSLEGVELVSEALLFDGKNKSRIVLSRSTSIRFEFESLPASLLSGIINANELLANYTVSGKFDMTDSGAMQAKFYFHEWARPSAKENVASLAVTAHFTKPDRIVLEQAILNLPASRETIKVTGYIDNNWNEASLNITADNVSAGSIKAFDGIGTPNNTKNWCNRSIKNGELINLNASLHINNMRDQDPVVQLKGQSKFRGLDLKYSETLPQIDGLNGEVTFDEKLINFTIAGGQMINTQLGASKVQIDLVDNDMPLTIKTDATGPVKDFINFIPASSLKRLEARNIKLSAVSGWTTAHIDMRIPLSKDVVLRNMELGVRADLKQFKLPLFGGINLAGDLILKIDNHLLSIIGSPLLNGEETDFKFESYLTDGMEFDNRLRFSGSFGRRKGVFTLLDGKVVVNSGLIPTNVIYVEKEGSEQLSIKAKLDDAQLLIPYLGIVKKASKAASFETDLEQQNDVWKTRKCEFISPEESTKIEVSAEFKQNFSLLTSLDATVQSKDNNLRIALTLTASEYKIRINGSSIVSNRDQLMQFISSQGLSTNTKLSVFINLDKVTLKHGVTLNKISGSLSCYKNKCTNDAISMKIKDGNGPSASMKIYNEDGAFIIQTDNASALLKGLDLYHELNGGSMIVKLYSIKDSSTEAMHGELRLNNFQAIKTSLIGKLILLTPFSQIVERLKGQTLISFRSFEGSFLVKDKILEVSPSIAYGDLLTVTIKGYIDLLQKQIALKGRIIPNSLFNNLLSGIQDKNKGSPESYKMGTNYKIDGSLSQPRVIVSPIGLLISLLTKPLSII